MVGILGSHSPENHTREIFTDFHYFLLMRSETCLFLSKRMGLRLWKSTQMCLFWRSVASLHTLYLLSVYYHFSYSHVLSLQASIQGPQGWDIVTNWIVEKVRRTKRSTRWGRRGPVPHVPSPRLPILRVESPSGDTSPVMQARAVTVRPSFLRATSLRWIVHVLESNIDHVHTTPRSSSSLIICRLWEGAWQHSYYSFRTSRESVVDPWMLSLHHIRQARSLREMSVSDRNTGG